MKWQRQRKAFSMMTAVFIIILMATVASFVMNTSGKMVKETTTQFQREQAVLLANSYTEYAIMAVMANEHNSTNCLNIISGNFGGATTGYNTTVEISYIGNGTLGTCAKILSNTVATPKSPLNIIVDTFVRYPDHDHPDGLLMTYHSRRLLKI